MLYRAVPCVMLEFLAFEFVGPPVLQPALAPLDFDLPAEHDDWPAQEVLSKSYAGT